MAHSNMFAFLLVKVIMIMMMRRTTKFAEVVVAYVTIPVADIVDDAKLYMMELHTEMVTAGACKMKIGEDKLIVYIAAAAAAVAVTWMDT